MRIAYFLADHGIPVFGNKGASVHVREMAKALSVLGHEVTVFCAKRGHDEKPVPYQVIKVAADAITEEVDETDPLVYRRAKEERYMRSAQAMQELFAQMHREQAFDAIYERYSLWSAAGVRSAQSFGLPVMVEVNAPLLKEQQQYRQLACAEEAEKIEGEVFSCATTVVAVSSEVANYIRQRGGVTTPVEVMTNAVDEERFHPAVAPADLKEARGRCVIGFCGTLKAWHGVEILIEAFRDLSRRFAGLHLLIIGDGPIKEWLQGYTCGAALEQNVTLAGWVEHDDVAALLARSDILVAPYPELEDFYFSPLKLFEYLALGKPVVASEIGQIRDIVQSEHNGLLVPAGNAQALADALQYLIVDSSQRQLLAQAAARCGARYTWRGNARRVVELFTECRPRSSGSQHG